MRNDDDCYRRGYRKRLFGSWPTHDPALAPRGRGNAVTGSGALFLVVVILIVGYVGSLWLNPWVKCSRCNGKPRVPGVVFTYSLHLCRKCRGTGRQLRLGRRFIFGRPQ
jgi:hypothetical protein